MKMLTIDYPEGLDYNDREVVADALADSFDIGITGGFVDIPHTRQDVGFKDSVRHTIWNAVGHHVTVGITIVGEDRAGVREDGEEIMNINNASYGMEDMVFAFSSYQVDEIRESL